MSWLNDVASALSIAAALAAVMYSACSAAEKAASRQAICLLMNPCPSARAG